MSSSKLKFNSYGKTIDGTTYCSAVETQAENIIEDNEEDATIVFPSKDGWASLRSSAYRMTTENAEACLPLPIYKLKKILLKPVGVKIKTSVSVETPGGTTINEEDIPYTSYKDDSGIALEYFDISEHVLTSTEWQTLIIAKNQDEYLNGVYKDNTFYWEKGDDKIPFLGTVYKIAGDFIENFFGLEDKTPTWERLIRKIFKQHSTYFYEYKYGFAGEETRKAYINAEKTTFLSADTDVRNWKFRIEYVPMTSKTKIRARKNAPTNMEYIQPFNQRAEINAASAFGKNMWLTAQKTGVKQIKLVKNYTKLSEIIPMGAVVRHNGKKYRVVGRNWLYTNTVYVQVSYTLSENWTSRSKHVAVDQKYRNWSIPQEILWRNLYWEDYLRAGVNLKDEANDGGIELPEVMKLFNVSSTDDKTINSLCWYPCAIDGSIVNVGECDDGSYIGATSPCSTYGIANSMIFSATFKDNLSAGLRAPTLGTDNLCEEALYCKEDGTVETAKVVLSSGLTNGGDEAAAGNYYPSILEKTDGVKLNAEASAVLDKMFFIYKDPGEALKFTYQIHLIGEDDCFFGNKFAEHNPLVKDWKGAPRALRLWLCKHYIREGADVLENPTGDSYLQTNDGEFFSVENGILSLTQSVLEKLDGGGYKSWVITDEKNNIYMGCNNVATRVVHFKIQHKRRIK